VITVDTLSHEGILEDQGRDPHDFFARYGVAADAVLADRRRAGCERLAARLRRRRSAT